MILKYICILDENLITFFKLFPFNLCLTVFLSNYEYKIYAYSDNMKNVHKIVKIIEKL